MIKKIASSALRAAVIKALAAVSAGAFLIPGKGAAAGEIPWNGNAWKIGLTVGNGYFKQEYGPHTRIPVHLPDFIVKETAYSDRTTLIPGLGEGILTDNPLFHGAMYSDIRFVGEKNGVRIATGLVLEHRGASYGTFSAGSIVVIPEFHACIDTFFHVAGHRIEFGLGAGNYDDFKLGEGLTIYNIDMQGGSIYAGWRGLEARYTQIGDLTMGIGLGIGDLYDYTLSMKDIRLYGSLKMTLRAGYYKYYIGESHLSNLPDDGMNFSAAVRHPAGVRFYSQLGIREVNESSQSGLKRCAHVAGADYGFRKGALETRLVAERRFYGRYFNLGYKSATDFFYYRSNSIYDQPSTVGEYIYPLEAFKRPFSQWAVYTEYQGRDVQTLIMRAQATYDLPRRFELICDLDFNHLEVSSEEAFLYAFYNAGAGWEPVEDILLTVTHTNRGMNLDRHYPTLYQMKNGTLMFALQANLGF